MKEEMDPSIVEILFVKAMVELLKNDEGMIIHHEGRGYAVSKNSANGTIELSIDEDYLEHEHGQFIWMQYAGTEAHAPELEDIIMGDDITTH